MVDLVSLDTVKQLHRVSHDDDDGILQVLISAASIRITNHLNSIQAVDWYDRENDAILTAVPKNVEIAAAHLVGILYDDPSGDEHDADIGFLPKRVHMMLYSDRVPTLA